VKAISIVLATMMMASTLRAFDSPAELTKEERRVLELIPAVVLISSAIAVPLHSA
jgi:hypothetical protein